MSGDAQRPIVIVGAGLTGLSTALHLAKRCAKPILVLERGQRVGGKARSWRRDGYTFDVTGHWLHLRDSRVKALVGELFDPGDLVEIERRTGVYTHGVMLPYPFQANLYGLPLPVVSECLVGFVEAQRAATEPDAPRPKTFEEFAVARFGAGIARHFFVPYNTKLWGMHPDGLTSQWVSRFIPIPNVEQVIGGAIGLRQDGLGYNARFVYPAGGGIDALPQRLAAAAAAAGVEIRFGTDVQAVDASTRTIRLRDGQSVDYETLVSTLPLPELVDKFGSATSPSLRAAAGRLRSVPWRYLDVATKTQPPLREHWVYVPDPHLPFFRVGIYSNALPAMAPPGAGSLYVELNDRESEPDLDQIFEHLAQMGAITAPEDVAFAEVRDIRHAYVVFDDAHAEATAQIHRWLDAAGVRSCGRYGAWIYNSMEDCIIEGMDAAAWATP